MSNCEQIPIEWVIKLQEELFKYIFQQSKLKLRIYQSSQRRKNFNYTRRPNPLRKNLQNVVGQSSKLGNLCFNEHENLPSIKILNEIKLDGILEGLIGIFNLGVQAEPLLLCNAIETQQKDEIQVKNIASELKQRKAKYEELQTQMAAKRKQGEDRMKQQDEKIATLRHSLKNMAHLNQLELNLVQKWEENRHTQAQIVTANAELLLQRQIKHYEQLSKAEKCRVDEAAKFIKLQMNDYQGQLSEWQDKFKDKLKECEKKRQEQEISILNLRKLHESQLEIYAHRVKYVQDYLAAKAAEHELLMQEMNRIGSAVQIQAWWRGIMVRRGLGQFRKKTKKSKKSKK